MTLTTSSLNSTVNLRINVLKYTVVFFLACTLKNFQVLIGSIERCRQEF